ncbi:Carboxypeptidase regulatory-like domain-containing protein [Granulicella rosea]|uniref:Carboxypeptidase regulatory-like domain-containing protein n=1 Tax=Granulicella rosea TaxID=474952 RepID=A0A239CQR1_9BACT|nr:carboxypeptidase-like regulatory domain-containing protein [Granulicella rosea]SNS22001.1 Carboxypeptidase regulatory-like domain-containing protein [Granulicella rosea]
MSVPKRVDGPATPQRRGLCCLCALLFSWLACHRAASAQSVPQPEQPANATQIPAAVSPIQEKLPDSPSHAVGSVSGAVIDRDGKVVIGARVTLASDALSEDREAVSDAEGKFEFEEVPPGKYQLTINLDGLATGMASGVLKPGEKYEVPQIALQIAASTADVNVTISRKEIAEEEMHEEETQRLGGFLPNFYVVYDWHAPALSPKQKLKLATRTLIDPANFVVNAATAGVEQGLNDFKGYGQGAAGYGKRLGAANADFVSGTMIGGVLYPILFRQDPRYFYMGSESGHGIVKRGLYALSSAFICRSDKGKWEPNYSSVLGDLTSGAISNAYYPASNRNGVSTTVETGLLAAASDGVGNLIQEFVFKHLTPHAPKYAQVKE